MPTTRNNKLMEHLNYRVRVSLQDSRIFIGTFKAYDKHMNLILDDCEEFRKQKNRVTKLSDVPNELREQKRVLGFILLRGQHIMTMSIIGPPLPEEDLPKIPKLRGASGNLRSSRSAGRGLHPFVAHSVATPDLQGPVRGVGGPSSASMIPIKGGLSMMAPPPGVKSGMLPPGMGQIVPPPMPLHGMSQSGPPPMPLHGMGKSGPPPMPKNNMHRPQSIKGGFLTDGPPKGY